MYRLLVRAVLIGAHPDGECLRVDSCDNGFGISQNEIGRIWERLYRGDRSCSQPGLGLGLNYVKAVREAHGGTVQVRSALHQGSCFSILLPAVAECLPEEADRQLKSQTNGAWSDNLTSGIKKSSILMPGEWRM
ncbi:MAG: HAMP domain-containing histidine kinase [Desulfobulbaceae bacterium]|nr:MAG: HAMP domain-containing histidine kinase [Desulfobulbaceae bacterium]